MTDPNTCDHQFIVSNAPSRVKTKNPVPVISCLRCKLFYEDFPQDEDEHVHIYEKEGAHWVCCAINEKTGKVCEHSLKT